LELIPGREQAPVMKEGEYLTRTQRATDYQDVFRSVGEITEDLKVITSDLKTYTHTDQSVVAKILTNMEVLTANMATFSEKNAKNMDAVVSNLAALTADLRHLSSEGGEDLEVALQRISEITGKVNEGQGTIGRLINDDSTVEKTNEVLDNLSDVTRTYFGMQAVLGYHLEYLGEAGSAKNYFSIQLKPRPDKYFEFGVVYNPNPPGSTSTSTEVIETNGVTTTINRETTDFSKVRFNALLAKQFDDFTVKGGLIESTGGVGVDYERGPAALRFDAYDFGDGNAHLKAMAELNVTPAFYILGGADDLTGKQRRDYFFGAGLRFGDEDIKSLLGGAALFLSR
jgi:phospholipid/cholesterol/gamma-HCH transport system substrate-binding protein